MSTFSDQERSLLLISCLCFSSSLCWLLLTIAMKWGIVKREAQSRSITQHSPTRNVPCFSTHVSASHFSHFLATIATIPGIFAIYSVTWQYIHLSTTSVDLANFSCWISQLLTYSWHIRVFLNMPTICRGFSFAVSKRGYVPLFKSTRANEANGVGKGI